LRNLGYAFTLEAVDKSINIGIPILNMIGSAVALATVIETGGASMTISKALLAGTAIIASEWSIIYNTIKLSLYFSNRNQLLEKLPSTFVGGSIKLVGLKLVDGKISRIVIELVA